MGMVLAIRSMEIIVSLLHLTIIFIESIIILLQINSLAFNSQKKSILLRYPSAYIWPPWIQLSPLPFYPTTVSQSIASSCCPFVSPRTHNEPLHRTFSCIQIRWQRFFSFFIFEISKDTCRQFPQILRRLSSWYILRWLLSFPLNVLQHSPWSSF